MGEAKRLRTAIRKLIKSLGVSTPGLQLPWRDPPYSDDPLRVLLAELMLIRTKHKQVARIFTAIRDLGAQRLSDPARLRPVLLRLGLKHRARGIEDVLGWLAHRGYRIPDTRAELKEIPYVGDYIASAVLCFAFGKSEPVVDSNVIRFTERFFCLRGRDATHPSTAQMDLWEKIAQTPEVASDPRTFFRSLLDFCITVCAPVPRCPECPLLETCPFPAKKLIKIRSANRKAASGGNASPIWGSQDVKVPSKTKSSGNERSAAASLAVRGRSSVG